MISGKRLQLPVAVRLQVSQQQVAIDITTASNDGFA